MKIYFIIYLSLIIDNRTRHSNSDRQNSNSNNRNTVVSISMDGIGQNNYLS